MKTDAEVDECLDKLNVELLAAIRAGQSAWIE
jgi:hypothetical protein